MRIGPVASVLAMLLGATLAAAQGDSGPGARSAPARVAAPPPAQPGAPEGPDGVGAASALIMDAESGRVLWSRAPRVRRYPASTTKILTSLLLLEHSRDDETVTAPAKVDQVGESSLHLVPGEQVRAHDLLYAMMLRSANDACYAVARHIAGSQAAFAKLMNERAAAIGATDSHFTNPHGLHDPQHYTTAYDLALIAREAMRNPEFEAVARTQRVQIRRSLNQADRWLVNKNKQLAKDPTVDGVKTGYTEPAGRCFVGSATRNGFRVITVVLKSDDWQRDHVAMLRWTTARFEKRTVVRAGERVGTIPVAGGEPLAVAAGEDLQAVVQKRSVAAPRFQIECLPLTAPVARGQHVGRLALLFADGSSQRVDLVAAETVEARPDPGASAQIAGAVAAALALAFAGWVIFGPRKRPQ